MDDNFEQQVRNIIRQELAGFIGSSQYQFQKDAKFSDARNIQLGYNVGTQIGTAATQKVAFFGKTPVVQQSASDLGTVISLLKAYGLSS